MPYCIVSSQASSHSASLSVLASPPLKTFFHPPECLLGISHFSTANPLPADSPLFPLPVVPPNFPSQVLASPSCQWLRRQNLASALTLFLLCKVQFKGASSWPNFQNISPVCLLLTPPVLLSWPKTSLFPSWVPAFTSSLDCFQHISRGILSKQKSDPHQALQCLPISHEAKDKVLTRAREA